MQGPSLRTMLTIETHAASAYNNNIDNTIEDVAFPSETQEWDDKKAQ